MRKVYTVEHTVLGGGHHFTVEEYFKTKTVAYEFSQEREIATFPKAELWTDEQYKELEQGDGFYEDWLDRFNAYEGHLDKRARRRYTRGGRV